MNTLIDAAKDAYHQDGNIHINMESGAALKFPISMNPILSKASGADLNTIELSPCGIHWPTLDEDLSFEGILRGDFGQYFKR